MEDEGRPLPTGWVRQYDSKSHHQFFVDTKASPPRSIWHHPFDDEQYLATLPPSERADIQNHHNAVEDDSLSADELGDYGELPPRQEEDLGGGKKFGRKIKDKLTHSTHEQRVAERKRRADEEARAYEQHQHIRQQMSVAAETGVPQLLGKDKEGRDVYIEPPAGPNGFGYGGGSRGYNPYVQGPYSNPNAKFVRPNMAYGRPYPAYGHGYGGGLGYGAPLMGLGGGLMLGGLLF